MKAEGFFVLLNKQGDKSLLHSTLNSVIVVRNNLTKLSCVLSYIDVTTLGLVGQIL